MALRIAQDLTAGNPLTRTLLTPVVLSYSDGIASIPARHRYLSLNSGVCSLALHMTCEPADSQVCFLFLLPRH